jgi:23S rRNA pseudouridine1911/1915/1917 synthase
MSAQQLVIDGPSAGMRLDLYLTRHLLAETPWSRLSRGAIQKLIAEGQITLNGVPAKASTRVKFNDRVNVQPLPPCESRLRAEDLPLQILYEDPDCIVINKAPGIVVHPAAGQVAGTLVNALLHHCPELDGIGGERRPGIVHRLDKDTSGVMIVAKNGMALQNLVAQFKNRTVQKEYVALVWGKLEPAKGIIDRPIGRHRSDRKRMSSVHFLHKRREAVTEWRVEERFAFDAVANTRRWLTLLRLRPRTGRTHQIRVHLADLGYPLVGDRVYGRKRKSGMTKPPIAPALDEFPRQALHAEKLVIDHVRTGRRMEFCAPLPKDLQDLLGFLQGEDHAGTSVKKIVTRRG